MRRLKRIYFLRGVYRVYHTYFCIRKSKFEHLGKNVTLTPPTSIGNPKNVWIGDNVSIGPNCTISAVNARFVVEGNTAIAEGLSVHTGNHELRVGKFVTDISESTKSKGFDKDIIVENDVWIGCNVTLLSGVRVGRGSIVAAGAVVTKSFPPYSVIGGVPAKLIKQRLTEEEIVTHEAQLYNLQDRLPKKIRSFMQLP